MLPLFQRLHKKADYIRLHQRGMKSYKDWVSVVWDTNGGGSSRIGVVVPNSTARKATQRNVLKRKIRSAAAGLLKEIPQGIDLIITARAYPKDIKSIAIISQLSQVVRHALMVKKSAVSRINLKKRTIPERYRRH